MTTLTREQKIRKARAIAERNARQPIRPQKGNEPQILAAKTKADVLFYGGAAGGGKSMLICIYALTQHKRSCIYRRTSKQGYQIRQTLHEIVTANGGKSRHDKTEFELNGRLIHFRSLEHWSDVEGLQGNEYDLMAFDECTQFPQAWIDYLSTWNRSSNPDQVCRMVLTSNPPTSSDGAWVKAAFAKWIDPRHPNPAKSGETHWFVNVDGRLEEADGPNPTVIDGQTRYPHSRCFIQANALDNKALGERYYNKLDSLPETLKRAFKYGDWSVMDQDGANQFFPSAWIEAAIERWHTFADHLPIHAIGCDVAGSADIEKRTDATKKSTAEMDNSAQAHYDGNRIVKVISVNGRDTAGGEAYCNWLKLKMIGCEIHNQPQINVDSIWGGAYEYVSKDPFFAEKVNPIHFGESSDIQTEDGMIDLTNVKTALYWYFRTRLDPNGPNPIGLPPNHARLIAGLKGINFQVMGRKLIIEKKSDMRERVGFSPDEAEACIYALAHEVLGGYSLSGLYGYSK